jgi:DNA-binding GntR family transcriptional regulator
VANLKFKHELFEICQNRLLVRAARLYDDQFQYFRLKTFTSREAREMTLKRHSEITRAVGTGDGPAAERAMRALLEAAFEYQLTNPAEGNQGVSRNPRRATGRSDRPMHGE